jgi:hypothetical protein
MTLCLYGKVYAEQFLDYKSAIQYFSDALAADLDAVYVYPLYIQALIDYEQYDQADKNQAVGFDPRLKKSDFSKKTDSRRQPGNTEGSNGS